MELNVAGVVEVARWWWAFIIRGVLAILFGVVAFLAPERAVLRHIDAGGAGAA